MVSLDPDRCGSATVAGIALAMDALHDRVLFIDAEALVIDKPAGLAVHPGPSTATASRTSLATWQLGFRRPPSTVHRLDRDTSGCLGRWRATTARTSASPVPSTRASSRSSTSPCSTACRTRARARSTCRWPRSPAASRAGAWFLIRAASPPSPIGGYCGARRPRPRPVHARDRPHPPVARPRGERLPAWGSPAIPFADRPGPDAAPRAGALRVPRDGKPDVETRAPLPAPFREAGFDDDDFEIPKRR